MLNKGLFSSLFIEELKDLVEIDDAAQGRMATLAQTWGSRNTQDTESLWESFLKQALSYLEFVPSGNSTVPDVYPLFEDWGFNNCIAVLYLAPPESDIDDVSVGSFYPAKLMAQLKKRKLNWGILTNGALWRLYSTKSSRLYEDYVELHLEQSLEGSDEAEYGLFERFFHKDSFIAEVEDAEGGQQDEAVGVYKCRLDRDREQSEQLLEDDVKTPFLAQVDEVLQYICNGFIFDTQKSGEEYTEEERAEIFESAVKLIYRCLFLFYAEARRLLPSDPEKVDLYHRHSIQALCREARKFRWGKRRDTDQYDLWKHLKGLINAVNDGDPEYGIMGYNGGLFDDEEELFLGQHQLRNDFMCRALYLLAYVDPYNNEPDDEYAIPYEDLEVRHLGELYENILEFTVLLAGADRIRRRTQKGVEMLLASQTTKKQGDTLIKKGDVYFGESALERKQTGSYYTPESLVRFLNEKTIIQPLHEIFEQNYRQRFNELLEQAQNGHDAGTRRGAAQAASVLIERFAEEEVLEFKVCDPAMGSGHFLMDAANQMAGLVVALLEEVPHVDGMRVSVTSRPNEWRRRITRHCIYGVDLNPLAVNLAKLSLWLNCFAGRHKLTFLDHHIRCGNSLIGIRSLDQLSSIPERRKKSNKKKDKQGLLFDYNDLSSALAEAGQGIASITQIDEDDTDSQKAVLDEALDATSHLRSLADLFTAYLMDPEIQPGDYKDIFERLAKGMSIANPLNPALPEILESVEAYRKWHHFYHWPLEFPDVFGPEGDGGFSATVGNPPWDVMQPNTQEFYAKYDPDFRSYKKPKALKVIGDLHKLHPSIEERWATFEASFHRASSYCKEKAAFASLQTGKIDLYRAFLERFFQLLSDWGHMGIVVHSGFYTDKACQPLRKMFFSRSDCKFLYCFENKKGIFNIHRSFKIVLFGTRKGSQTKAFKTAFMEHDPDRLPMIHADAIEMKTSHVKLFAPTTLSIMEFRNQRDIDVTSRIYDNFPLIIDDVEDSWNISFTQEFNMTIHSRLFLGKNEIETRNAHEMPGFIWVAGGNLIDMNDAMPFPVLLSIARERNMEVFLPLYEGKNIHLFDASYTEPQFHVHLLDGISAQQEKRLCSLSHPKVIFRALGQSGNERNCISAVIPEGCFSGNSVYYSIYGEGNISEKEILMFQCLFSSFVIDYVIRQKIDKNLRLPFLETLPLPRLKPAGDSRDFFQNLVYRCARLTCTGPQFAALWEKAYDDAWQIGELLYPDGLAAARSYGPRNEQDLREELIGHVSEMGPTWKQNFGLYSRLPDRRDTGDRAQFRAEIDAYVAHLYGLSRDDFAYILDTFPVLKKKEMKAFGEYMSKRKCLEEYDRIKQIMNAE